MKRIPLVLPPFKEQQRIVAKLEKLMAKVDQCKARLDKIPSILKRFRQSVLAVACSGELTKEWREEHGRSSIGKDTDKKSSYGWEFTNLKKLTQVVTSGSRGWAKYYSEKGALFIRA